METTKITAESLMIGDWVKIKEPNKYAGAIGTIQSLSSLEGAYLAIYINDPNFGTFVTDVFCEDIEPIPLTAEILEGNGIQNYSEISEYKVKTNEYEIWVIIDEPQNCVHVEKFDKSIPTIYHSKILFVHELQHALRLCGINDKEIVL